MYFETYIYLVVNEYLETRLIASVQDLGMELGLIFSNLITY
ncbi:hypothetical protein COO91_05839 [Nostoc flagelliforme CCNUN1]|uniref:Uncharacterized protein n=1 Tax=Nostoc flagelliforme CCNUN1 TaxID=2038116 RepID=A0A2K8SWN9_9NOSO|nr:hypothetical protein COO91_05839 [Nostoc flagelliforme CCNUN1]